MCDFSILKSAPEYENKGVNAAVVYSILEYFKSDFNGTFYICDGSRSIMHETKFQDYLEKYFGFRKEYCRLNIKYRWFTAILVKLLFPFYKYLKLFDNNSLIHKICGALFMEEILRSLK